MNVLLNLVSQSQYLHNFDRIIHPLQNYLITKVLEINEIKSINRNKNKLLGNFLVFSIKSN